MEYHIKYMNNMKDDLQKLENLTDDLLYYWTLFSPERQLEMRTENLEFVKTIEDIRYYLEGGL